MKAALLLAGWMVVGLVVARRRSGPPMERALSALFWPFFLGDRPTQSPLDRLRAALAPGDPARGLVAELEAALQRLAVRQARIETALAELGTDPSGPSRRLLEEALARLVVERSATLAAVDEAAARLTLLDHAQERGEVEALLRHLRGRLVAGEEVEPAWSAAAR